jgi:NAD(P)-dependent dehydrogenase (short-subunit alcohol dehydrogenase family)
LTFTKTIAGEVADYGINANCIAPGAVETEMMPARPKELLYTFREGAKPTSQAKNV